MRLTSLGRRLILVVGVLIVWVPTVFASHHLPTEADPVLPESALEIHTHGRLFYTAGELSGMLEYVGRFEDEEREFRYQSVTLGGYYRLLRNLKAGLFYRLQFNVRHDNDWIEPAVTWVWDDTSGRAEHMAILDITPRFLLDFLPVQNLVFASKFRYEINFSTSEHSLLARPGLTYFWVRDREPVLNVSAQYATYWSLNFGAVPWYKHGPYLNVLYHLTPNIQLDIGASRQSIYWSESEEFLAAYPTSVYEENIYSPWIVDLGFVLKFR